VSFESSRFGDGDRQAFAEVYRRYADWFWLRMVKRYGSQDADEITQEAWLRLAPYQARGEVRNAKALLLRIAENLVAERFRRAQRFERSAWQINAWSGGGVEDAAQSDELLLRDLIVGLPQPLRDVFVLSRFGGLTNVEIAGKLGISPKTVEWRMTKALAHCAAELRR